MGGAPVACAVAATANVPVVADVGPIEFDREVVAFCRVLVVNDARVDFVRA